MTDHQTPTPPTLRAYRDGAARCWMLDASQAANADHIRQLFGGTDLPTPFTLDASPVDVGLTLGRLNPEHRILIEQHCGESCGRHYPTACPLRCPYRGDRFSAAQLTVAAQLHSHGIDQTAAGLQIANAISAAVYGPRGEHR